MWAMRTYRFTEYFEKEVMQKRPYLKKEWCIRIVENPLKTERRNITAFGFGERLRNMKTAFWEL
jgi:hypothetical protein